MRKGIIYLITNKINNKKYVGQTRNTLSKRWKDHKYEVNSGRKRCIHLHNAMEKYGFEKFSKEILLYCDLKDLDIFEQQMIKAYITNNRKFGYNLTPGGGGYNNKKVKTSEERRIELSKQSSSENSTGIPNILYVKSKGQIVGYRVCIVYDRKEYRKVFRHSKYSLEENLEFAKQWLANFKNGIIDLSKMNKIDSLPKHIYYYKSRSTKEIIGYVIRINRNNVKKEKTITDSTLSMDEKLQISLIKRDEILNSLRENQ